MNGRRQRKYRDLERLMRSHRHAQPASRDRRYRDGDGGEGGGGGLTVVAPEFPKIEVPAQFSLDNPEKDVPAAIEKMRLTLIGFSERGTLTQETFGKIVADLKVIEAVAKEAREGTRKLLRDAPGPDDSDKAFPSLRGLSLSLKVTGEVDEEAVKVFQPLERFSAGRLQYNLMAKTAAELGFTDERAIRAHRRLQQLHNAAVMVNAAHEQRSDHAYFQMGAHKQLPFWPELQQLAKKFFVGALADATAAEGLEWVVTGMLSRTIEELIELEQEFSGVFQTFPMQLASGPWPIKGSHGKGYYIQENTAGPGESGDPIANAKVKLKSWGTNNVVFTARKFAAGLALTTEWEEDAVVNSGAYAEAEVAKVLAITREDALVNAQRSGAIDAGSLAADDGRLMYDGIRKIGRISGKAPRDLGSGITADDLVAMFGGQGAAGARPKDSCWLTSTAGYARLMVAKASDNSPVWLTLAQAGLEATAKTGAMGAVFGRPVYTSAAVSEKMEADGTLSDVDAPTGNRTALYHIYHRTMKIGRRRGVLISGSEHVRFLEEQKIIKGTCREDFKALQPPTATNILVTEGNNIPTF